MEGRTRLECSTSCSYLNVNNNFLYLQHLLVAGRNYCIDFKAFQSTFDPYQERDASRLVLTAWNSFACVARERQVRFEQRLSLSNGGWKMEDERSFPWQRPKKKRLTDVCRRRFSLFSFNRPLSCNRNKTDFQLRTNEQPSHAFRERSARKPQPSATVYT